MFLSLHILTAKGLNKLIPLSKLPLGRSAILSEIGCNRSVRQRLLRYGLSVDAPIFRYATAPRNRGGVWRQGSLLIALREREASNLFCKTEDEIYE